MDMYEYEDNYWDEYDEAMPEDEYEYDDSWDLEVGFDPYLGCYTDDC